MKLNYRIIFIILSVLSGLILLADFFIIEEYSIEAGYLCVTLTVLILNISRLIFFSNKNKFFIDLVFNFTVIGITSFNLYILALTSFGYGFTGKDPQLIHYFAFLINLLFFISLILGMGKEYKSK